MVIRAAREDDSGGGGEPHAGVMGGTPYNRSTATYRLGNEST